MLYLAALFAPFIVFAWTRRAWWTGLTLISLPIAILALGIPYIVIVAFAVKFTREYYAASRGQLAEFSPAAL